MFPLFSETEFLNQLSVALHVFLFEIAEEAPPLANEFQKATPRLVILFVFRKVFLQPVDPLCEQSDLDFGTSRIALRALKLFNDFRFPIRMQSHGVYPYC